MTLKTIFHKINNRWTKLRLQPIRVFCLHHISQEFDAASMCDGDWMEISIFKNRVEQMQQEGYTFISLEDAYRKIQKDIFRRRKYAVLTADDGYKSLEDILSWLIEQKIPITLFINGKYTDGKSQRIVEGKHFTYLTKADLQHYVEASHGLISIQSHGYEHLDATAIHPTDFRLQIEKNIIVLDSIKSSPMRGVRGVCLHAYTWGRHNAQTDAILKEMNVIPVLMDGMKNYNDASCIHRELLGI